MLFAPNLQLLLQSFLECSGQHHDTVLITLSLANQNLVSLPIHIFDAQPAAFHEPQTRAVHEACHELVKSLVPLDGFQQRADLAARHDHRQSPWPIGPHRIHAAQLDPQYLLVEKHQRIERLRLRACGNMTLHG